MLEQLSDKKMTAYEIAQRIGEKLEQFTPIFDRRVTEFLNPLLARTFGILYRMGKFGPAPEALLVPTADGASASLAMPEIAITSRISLALKALQNQGMVNTLSVIQPLAQERPDILDNIDMDTMVRELARNYGVPPDLLLPIKQVQATRRARAQQMAAQQALEMAQGAAKAGKDLEKSPSELKEAVTGSLMGRSGQ
jgi:soluble lytic murein transglycosylase-like protein